jgi:hypothetical protein
MSGARVLLSVRNGRVRWSAVGSLIVFLIVGHRSVIAQESLPDFAKDHPLWNQYFAQVASSYDLRPENDLETHFEVTPQPVYSYFTQGPGLYNHGTLFLWTHVGRPKAIASFWCEPVGGTRVSVNHEMHSLSSEPLRAARNGRDFWTPRERGLTFDEVPTKIRPSATRDGRLIQMQLIARQFSGSVIRAGRNPEKDELQTQEPLFRYDEREDATESLDGAVFGLFEVGDPEIILVIEARSSESGLRWYFAAARFCTRPPVLELDGEELWAVGRIFLEGGHANTPNDVYYAAHQVDTIDLAQLSDLIGEREPVATNSSPKGHAERTSAGQRSHQQQRLTWEYRELEIHGGHFDKDEANKLGKEGWELVSSFAPRNRDGVNVLVFKRRE